MRASSPTSRISSARTQPQSTEADTVNGRATRKGTMDGRDISTAIRYTRVYANREGRWQVVQFQQTRVAADSG